MAHVPGSLFLYIGKTSAYRTLIMTTLTKNFILIHKIGSFTEEQLMKLQKSPVDEFGVSQANVLYNPEADIMYCILDAPNKNAIVNHHSKFGCKCDWITEIKTTA